MSKSRRDTLETCRPPGGWPSKPVGSRTELDALARCLIEEACALGSLGSLPQHFRSEGDLRGRLFGVAVNLLRNLRDNDGSPTLAEEKQRVDDARGLAVDLRNKLLSLYELEPMMLELHRLGADEGWQAETLPSSTQAAKALVWGNWPPGFHPLDALSNALDAYKGLLAKLPVSEKNDLHRRRSDDPRRGFVTTCVRIYEELLGAGTASKQEEGRFADFVALLWHYATGLDAASVDLRRMVVER